MLSLPKSCHANEPKTESLISEIEDGSNVVHLANCFLDSICIENVGYPLHISFHRDTIAGLASDSNRRSSDEGCGE